MAKKVAKKSAKKAISKGAPAKSRRADNGLTGSQVKVLKALRGTSPGTKEMTRGQLAEKTGINKGWSKLLGASSRGADSKSLEGLGYIKVSQYEGDRSMMYSITAAGKKILTTVSD